MSIKLIKLTNKIFLLIFESEYNLSTTFLRFEEFYESPEFSGKFFTLKEFKKWYSSPKGTFTYYKDWNGFNISSYTLEPFYEGKFDPLTKKEKRLLKLFKNMKGKFYIIGISRKTKDIKKLLKHELAHGFFYTVPKYKNKVIEILSEFNLTKIKEELRAKKGYCENVLDDESHAYILAYASKLKIKIPIKILKKLEGNYQKYLKMNNVHFPDL